MLFQVVDSRFTPPKKAPCILLERNSWDDYGYKTLFRAHYVDSVSGTEPPQPLGRVKILERGNLSPSLGSKPFEGLPEAFCSLGQESEYYDRLHTRGAGVARDVLVALRDVALTPAIEAAFADAPGFKVSLLRFPNAELARAHARSLFGVARKESEGPLKFTFACKLEGFEDEHRVDFAFPDQKQDKLGRIVAIAGRNGTGKTQLIARLAHVLSGLDAEDPKFGRIEPERRSRVVVVSFNAFDRFTTPRDNVPGNDYTYYGLRSPSSRTSPPEGPPRPGGILRGEVDVEHALVRLAASIESIWRMGVKHQGDWQTILGSTRVLENEPQLVNPFASPTRDPLEMRVRIRDFVAGLKGASAGHQLLVFIVTALVESVRERSIILLDEPETYLHPRLLSTLVRLLYDMLVERDAYAVIATHSPIVLQEIPGRAIRLLRICEGRLPLVRPYPRESFGESLDEIIKEAFGVHENDRSYATILEQLVRDGLGRAEIDGKFDGLGYGARLLLRELLESRAAR
ncbi:AAA family ATPase [Sorangium sp. So ce1153]|uniref:AAA family ATPase n=1 Tax=Sorangium sp. So ce1153 TaxID=3133333 RepID=UPI003F606EEC